MIEYPITPIIINVDAGDVPYGFFGLVEDAVDAVRDILKSIG